MKTEEASITRYTFSSPLGLLSIGITQEGMVRTCTPARNPGTTLAGPVRKALEDYFAGVQVDLTVFAAPPEGSDFRTAVLSALAKVPFGSLISYRDLAEAAGFPRAVRAAAGAVAGNMNLLFIPCHRVIRSDGRYGRFRLGSEAKNYLISLEQAARFPVR